jgi:hypothetical protein
VWGKTAGIVLYRFCNITGVRDALSSPRGAVARGWRVGVEVLLGYPSTRDSLAALCSRRGADETLSMTAMRGLRDATLDVIDDAIVSSLKQHIDRVPVRPIGRATSANVVEVAWLSSAKALLYLVNVDSIGGCRESTNDIVEKSRRSRRLRPTSAFKSLEWVPLASVMGELPPRAGTGTASPAAVVYAEQLVAEPLFMRWMTQLNDHAAAAAQASFCDHVVALREAAADSRVGLRARRAQHSTPTPAVPPLSGVAAVTDVVELDKSGAEAQSVLAQHSSHPETAVCVARVKVPNRESRFRAYVGALPSGCQTTVLSLHGTPSPDAAVDIARSGPDLSRAGSANGTLYGNGFYTAEDAATAEGYANRGGSAGCVLVLTVAPGNVCTSGSGSTTAATLAQQSPPCHSLHVNTTWVSDC